MKASNSKQDISIAYEGAPMTLQMGIEYDEIGVMVSFKLYHDGFRLTPLFESVRCVDGPILINKNSLSFRTTHGTELVITEKEIKDITLNLFEVSLYYGRVLYDINFIVPRHYRLREFIEELKEVLKGTDFIDENKEV
jgi:hypothetical protein